MKTVLLRPNKKAVSPVIGTILMVAITVVLAAVLYVMVTGLVGPPQGQKPNVVLTAGQWNNGNLTISFASITNAPNLAPTDLTYIVQSADGTTYFSGPATASPYGPTSGVNVSVAYTDNTNNLGKVSNDDTIRLTVSPSTSAAVKGGTFKIFYAGDVIGFINQLP
jgi:flagellin-like protein